ncbi:MAG: sigma-70 family RNA polymerase sigma factor [Bacteroidales bacterium]|nr:sigma-70 family RNA polymerase sigma factor [Bacteroidales bacterium]
MKEQSEVLQWVQDCRSGSTRAQHKLFRYFYGKVMSMCMRYAGSTDEAADMLNEGFLKVFSNLDKYENSGSFEAWLKRVVCNAALDYRRRYDKNVELVDIDEVQDSHLSDYNVNDAMSKISSEEIVGLIQHLPPVTRVVFNMYVFEGFSHREIAQQLDISENTSAWHVNQARSRLKESLKQYDNE